MLCNKTEVCLSDHGVCVCIQVPSFLLRPDLQLSGSQAKLVTITQRTVQIHNHQPILLPSQHVTMTATHKVQGKEVRMVSEAEQSLASLSEEGHGCICCLRAAAAAASDYSP